MTRAGQRFFNQGFCSWNIPPSPEKDPFGKFEYGPGRNRSPRDGPVRRIPGKHRPEDMRLRPLLPRRIAGHALEVGVRETSLPENPLIDAEEHLAPEIIIAKLPDARSIEMIPEVLFRYAESKDRLREDPGGVVGGLDSVFQISRNERISHDRNPVRKGFSGEPDRDFRVAMAKDLRALGKQSGKNRIFRSFPLEIRYPDMLADSRQRKEVVLRRNREETDRPAPGGKDMDPVLEPLHDELVVRRQFGLDCVPRARGIVTRSELPQDRGVDPKSPDQKIELPGFPCVRPQPESPGGPVETLHAFVDELRSPGNRRVEQVLVEAFPSLRGSNRSCTPENGVDFTALRVQNVHRYVPSVNLVPVGNPPDDPFIQSQPETFDLFHHLAADRTRAHVAARWSLGFERFPVEQNDSGDSSRFPEKFEKMKREESAGRTGADDSDRRPVGQRFHRSGPHLVHRLANIFAFERRCIRSSF